MQTTALDQATPWGVSRMKPFPPTEVLPAVRAILDHETQIAEWVHPEGTLVPALDRHKRSETSKETTTKTSLDGTSDEGSDQSGDTD